VTQWTKDEAVAKARTGWWESMPLSEAATIQLHQQRLAMPFDKFQEGMQQALGRPVWTHEFAYADEPNGLKAELAGKVPPADMARVLGWLPEDKTVVVEVRS